MKYAFTYKTNNFDYVEAEQNSSYKQVHGMKGFGKWT